MIDRVPEGDELPEDVDLMQLVAIPLRRWKWVAGVATSVVVLVVLYSLISPSMYTARTTIMPMPAQSDVASQLLTLVPDLPLGIGDIIGQPGHQEGLTTILESRSIADSIIARFDLKREWDVETAHDARAELAGRTSISQDRQDGHIAISYTDGEAARAARIANAYPEFLNAVSARMGGEAAVRRAQFLEEQIAYARQELDIAEQELVEFQRGTRSPEIEEQARQTVLAAAALQREIFTKEAELAQLQRVATPENPRLRTAASELSVLRTQLQRITGDRPAGETGDVLLSFGEAPELGVTYARLMRDYKKQEQIHIALTAGLAQSRIDAGNDVPIVTVLDRAVEPEIRSSPNRRRMALFALIGGSVTGLLTAFLVEWGHRGRGRRENQELVAAWRQFCTEVTGFVARRPRG